MTKIASESKYVRSFFNRRGKTYEILKKRYPRLVQRIEEAISKRRCPFCNREFKTMYALQHHMVSGPCSGAFHTLIDFLLDKASEEEVLRWLA